MILKRIKTKTCFVITGLMILTSFSAIPLNTVKASSDLEYKEETKNVNILNNDLSNFVYTYEEEGNSYKVVEQTSPDMTHVESKIYIKDSNGKYYLQSELKTDINVTNNIMEIKEISNGKINIETIDVNSFLQGEDDKNVGMQSRAEQPTITGWQHYSTTKGSNKFAKKTASVIAAGLGAAIGATVPGKVVSAFVGGSLSAIAAEIVNSNIDVVYNTQVSYRRWEKFKIGHPRAIGEKVTTTFYKDSARKKQIKSPVTKVFYVERYKHLL